MPDDACGAGESVGRAGNPLAQSSDWARAARGPFDPLVATLMHRVAVAAE